MTRFRQRANGHFMIIYVTLQLWDDTRFAENANYAEPTPTGVCRMRCWNISNFQANISDQWLRYLLWICLKMSITASHWWASVQLMAWCHQATSHCLWQCWPSYLSPCCVTMQQKIKRQVFIFVLLNLFMILSGFRWNATSFMDLLGNNRYWFCNVDDYGLTLYNQGIGNHHVHRYIIRRPGPSLNIQSVFPKYGDFHAC